MKSLSHVVLDKHDYRHLVIHVSRVDCGKRHGKLLASRSRSTMATWGKFCVIADGLRIANRRVKDTTSSYPLAM